MKNLTLSLLLIASAIGLAGCGAGGGGNKIGALGATSRGVGRATITLKWPVRTTSRLIPVAANRVVITMKRGGVSYGAPINMDRPTNGSYITTQTVDNIATGSYMADAFAYPDANPASTAQAKVLNQPFTVTDGETAAMNLTMASAITSFVVESAGGVTSIAPAATLQIYAAARDADNSMVLTSGTIAYSSNDTGVATVDAATGLVTGVAGGTARITVTDSESGVSGYIDVTVQPSFPSAIVADYLNNRIVGVNAASGSNWVPFGTGGGGVNNLSQPWGMATDATHHIYICDSSNSRIVRIDNLTGTGWVALSNAGGHSFSNPTCIALDSLNRIYVTDGNLNKIIRVDNMNGDNWTEYGSQGSGTGNFSTPRGLAIDASNKIYVADGDNNRVVRMDNMSGLNWTTLSTMGGSALHWPTGLALDSAGGIYVSDTFNDRIAYAANISDTVGASFGGPGVGVGQFSLPWSVALDATGHIFVTDRNNSRVVCINNMSGAGWVTLGANGSGAGQFRLPFFVLPY